MRVGYVLEKLLRFLEVENLCVFWVFLFWMPSIAFQPLATFIWNLLQKVSQFKIIVLNISLSFIYLFILACHVLVYAKQLVTQKAGNIFSSLPMLTSLISVYHAVFSHFITSYVPTYSAAPHWDTIPQWWISPSVMALLYSFYRVPTRWPEIHKIFKTQVRYYH